MDEALLEAAGLVEYERVDIYNVNNGQRFSTYVVKAPRRSGIAARNSRVLRSGSH